MYSRSTSSWILYDMANTLFSLSIVSLYFPTYLTEQGLPDTAVGVAVSASMLVMLVLSPVLGALSDHARRRIPFLVASTVLCVLFTLPLGLVSPAVALALFAVANASYAAGLVFYDALLPVVSTPNNRGRVAAIGVGVGYVGALVGLGLGAWILATGASHGVLFAGAGVAFLLLALPAFIWIREPAREARPVALAATVQTFGRLIHILRRRENPAMGQFLVARLFYADAVNTMILFMGVYTTQELGMDAVQRSIVLALGIVAGAVAAPFWGLLVDHWGPGRTLRAVLGAWMVGLLAAAAIPLAGAPPATFYVTGAFLGACLAGTWTADRPLVAAIAPPERLGEYFGFYAMIGRFSAIGGPLLWALVVDGLGWGRPVAVLSLLVAVVIGYGFLRKIDLDRPRTKASTA